MKRLFSICLTFVVLASAMALGTFNKVFHEKYDIKPGSNLAKLDCLACHVKLKSARLNTYGKDIAAAMKTDKAKKLTPAILAKVEGLDSNKNGKTNLEDIKADVNPGE